MSRKTRRLVLYQIETSNTGRNSPKTSSAIYIRARVSYTAPLLSLKRYSEVEAYRLELIVLMEVKRRGSYIGAQLPYISSYRLSILLDLYRTIL